MKHSSRYHHGNLRQAIIEVALQILDEKGIEAVGIRQVAREIGVAHSAPANHFKNKQALFTALAVDIFSQLLNKLTDQDIRKTDDVAQKLHHIAQSIMNYALMFPHRYRLLWRRDCLDNQDQQLNMVMDRVYKKLTETLSAHGQKHQMDVESLAIAFWSMVHGYVSLRLDGNLVAAHDAKTGEQRQKAIVDVMLKGLVS